MHTVLRALTKSCCARRSLHVLLIMSIMCCISCACFARFACVPEPPSDGAIEAAAASKSIEEYISIIGNYVTYDNNVPRMLIGHQAGNYQQYPMYPDKLDDKWNISESMDLSFNRLLLNAIEIDVRVGKDKNGTYDIYVIHEKLGDKDIPDYFKDKNSLKEVLKTFYIKHLKHRKDRKIFIEIKCDDSDELTSEDKNLIKKTLKAIDDLINSPSQVKADITGHLAFVSFNFEALRFIKKEISRVAKDDENNSTTFSTDFNNVEMYYIAGTNKSCWLSTWKCGFLNCISKMEKTLVTTDVLNGIWFDPYAIDDFAGFFNGINGKRKKLAKDPLKFHISTYKLDMDGYIDLLKDMKDTKDKLDNVTGLIFDINPPQVSGSNSQTIK